MTTAALAFPRPQPEAASAPLRSAIIDIGSNSIRLVVYGGPCRAPSVLFNEKVLAGLGRGLSEGGAIAPEALAIAKPALARFAALAREMEVDAVHAVATAAVRDASNGEELTGYCRKLGLEVRLLSGVEEATAAGRGVLSAIPGADGIVGDLGGGSLELVRLRGGAVGECASFPLGVLRIAALRERGKKALERHARGLLGDAGWRGAGAGLPFYLVGGSWRALARLDMHVSNYPLPVIHGYSMPIDHIPRLQRVIADTAGGELKAIPHLSSGRVPMLGDAAALLSILLADLGSDRTIVSAFGLREGLLYGALQPEQQANDPLIVAAREEGRRLGRFPEHGDLLDRWIAPIFTGAEAGTERLRLAACLLADVAWPANPDFRAERGMEIALHGNWVAIDARGRAMVAQALYTCFGGGAHTPEPLGALASSRDLRQAILWGLALRLGQRWSGGLARPLLHSTLQIDGGALQLCVNDEDAVFYGETVERRHRTLADAMGRELRLIRT
ncbi:Ppx/GppA family phosphatase [Stakelama saccharophila]|uniref:Ppx/GppA family phosphatase n=1 Tax=Stakelama saccharophila TaxID=3075605 RepID=A0ABZ0B583_9SPHN|nr:Ppx/GppA family phosphatase [Stakelama sp. W311]WNO52551.1 Ppx/GppA family phosphatase [Stakelama sp. W311]